MSVATPEGTGPHRCADLAHTGVMVPRPAPGEVQDMDNDDELEDGDLKGLDEGDIDLDDELEDGEDFGIDDDELGDDALVDDLVEDDDLEAPVPAAAPTGDDDEEDDLDELDPDDVEASLDVILKDRLVIEDAEEDEDDTPDTEDRAEGSGAVVPKRPDEFVCQSCFLVKHPSQLADAAKTLCRDCV